MTMRIVHSANIYTLKPDQPKASAIVLDHGVILDIGDTQTILDVYSHKSDLFDAGGMTVLPGLVDAHLHLEQYALSLQRVNCETKTRVECLERVAEHAKKAPAGAWILGHGWNQNDWHDGFGNATELDVVSHGQHIYLTAKSLHAAWANSAALAKAGIVDGTPDPEGGRIGRDENGHANGILFESAMQLVADIIPEPPQEQRTLAIKNAIANLVRLGLTGVHDFDRRECFASLQYLRQHDELLIRVLKSIPVDDLPHAIALGLRTGFGDNFLRIGGVKIFADGALGPRTAAMLQPYESDPDNRGILMIDGEELYEKGRLAVDNGLGLAIHAIGDRANHEVLKALTQLLRYQQDNPHKGGMQSFRHRIEHVQLIHPDDTRRLASLGVIASMQPIHATSDMLMADQFWGDRTHHAYAWRSQLDHGAVLAFGSDAPVESPNPFIGLHAAVTRQRADGTPSLDGWHPDQRLDILDAVRAYTIGPAYAAGLEDKVGVLTPGFMADLILLDTDLFKCDPEELIGLRPRATMVAGEWVYPP